MLSFLNPQQQEAVKTLEGPLLIIAGPGSGKTKVLTHRVAYLIKQGIPPQQILAVTFTNKAAQEMKERIKELLGDTSSVNNLAIGTFHAFGLRFLRQELPKPSKFSELGDKLSSPIRPRHRTADFTIYDNKDGQEIVKKILLDLDLSEERFKPAAILDAISQLKNDLIDAETYADQARDYYPKFISHVYSVYDAQLKKINALDLDDLINLPVKMLETNAEICQKYQKQFRYLLVDEAQDINFAQYKLINLLAKNSANLCLIGDFDQSIYSWRGADFRHILNFQKDYPQAKIIFLEQNYRSTKNILEAAQNVIKYNTNRLEKNLWTDNVDGDLITLYQARHERDEANFVVQEIKHWRTEKGYGLSSFAVLYRTNAQSRSIEEAFLKSDLPYKIIGETKFYDRKEIKDVLAVFKLTLNPADSVSQIRLSKIPKKYFVKTANKTKSIDERIKILTDELRQIEKTQPLNLLLEKMLTQINFADYLAVKTKNSENRLENIQELFTAVENFNHLSWPDGLTAFLEHVSLFSSLDEMDETKEAVTLMTLHCAKGLEFPTVFLTGCEESLFPHSRSSFDRSALEEERRLCYVGLTRAKEKLYLTLAQRRNIYGSVVANAPSRFIEEIPQHLIQRREAISPGYEWENDF